MKSGHFQSGLQIGSLHLQSDARPPPPPPQGNDKWLFSFIFRARCGVNGVSSLHSGPLWVTRDVTRKTSNLFVFLFIVAAVTTIIIR